EREHARAQRHHQPYSLFLLDVDYLGLINDGYGHEVGDRVLAQVGEAVRKVLRADDWVGRWGGDEFLCLVPETGPEAALPVVERLRERIGALRFAADGQATPLTVSIGLASFPRDGDRLDTLLTHIDSALYRAKGQGRNQVVQAGAGSSEVFSIGHRIEEALAQGRVRPVYQPIIDLRSGREVAEEALARLHLPDGTLMPAEQFIATATALRMVHRIDHAIISQVIARYGARIRAGEPPLLHFVNISVDLLHHPALVQELLDKVRQDYDGERIGAEKPLVIEVTEREFLEDPQEALRVLRPLLDFGLRLAVDDFGSGYSSFLYLAELPISYLKIEMKLVQRARHDARILAMVKGIQRIARDLGLVTIAEGIEDEATARLVREAGIDWGQGYYFGRPALDLATEPTPCGTGRVEDDQKT
ncbi:MAG: bifunctional diguanylate cyclase/phosphodiesterase, partial [Gammaproteobacteria bacterium]|nr:bifunctional diguanylate cyclase/phosphodiesterase [Gammaproteobacteria bacterium]